ncbi:MAG TPA: C45 family autoproteolytic acyltransferase/hydrolase [Gemmataceae bacterium]|nr:C45 family autoproteolytic acyltransferase/hydrolase [Gemmataceae bacterium]
MPLSRRVLLVFALLVASPAVAKARSAPSKDFEPDPASVKRYGPAYRYPQAGWVVLHIEGEPYERGYQHGQLMSAEIADHVNTLATARSPKAPADGWRDQRLVVNALFLRRYDKEFLEEMKGIADGAAAAGAKFDGRAIDLMDVVALNSGIEIDFLEANLEATPHGLEGTKFKEPQYPGTKKKKPAEHCSAFAATGPATADGKVVFGHITMWSLYHVRHYNVWLDVKPRRGNRVLMQSYPGGIMSGLDYYMNDAGLLVAETTIKQTRFDSNGESMVSRIRKALQYGSTIDEAVKILEKANNGVYTNEWLLADTKTNEIAMFELGTHKSRLWRSSKDEWVGGTQGFYWGCNNAKDLQVRLETVPSVEGKPANMVFAASDRDQAWLKLYDKHKGKITADFGFEAFTMAPLAAFPSCDAKFTTSAMAKDLKTWALFGPPRGRTWDPSESERTKYSDVRPLVSNDWAVLTAAVPKESAKAPVAADLKKPKVATFEAYKAEEADTLPAAWHGTVLPKSDADAWLAAAFADYEKIVALEKSLKAKATEEKADDDEKDRVAVARFEPRSRYLTAVRRLGRDVPLAETRADPKCGDWYDLASGKGMLLLADLRTQMGDEKFEEMMDAFGRANAGKEVTTAQFREHAEKACGKPLASLFDPYVTGKGRPDAHPTGYWSIFSFEKDPEKALIVYGTLKDKNAQREAAGHLARKIQRRWCNHDVPVKADTDVSEADLKGHHLLIIGRPETNAVAAKVAKGLPVTFGAASFVLRKDTYAHAGSAVVAAGENPLNPRYSVVVYAGLSAEATWQSVRRLPEEEAPLVTEALLMPAGSAPKPVIASAPQEKPATADEEKSDNR